jgi:hypothetical protein
VSQFGPIARMRGRGVGAVLRRILRELYAPETRVGLAARPVTAPLSALLRATRKTPERRDDKGAWADTLTFFYDLDVAPITFDFVCFLALAEAMRRQRGLRRLEVVFVPGRKDGLRAELQSYEDVVDATQRRWRLHNVCIPLIALAPGCRGYSIAATREQGAALFAFRRGATMPEAYDPGLPEPPSGRALARFAAAGEIKVLASPEQSLAYVRRWIETHAGGRKVVTITLREYGFMPERNSNFAAWAAFARELDPAEYCVVVIPDAETAMGAPRAEFADFVDFREACWNVALRSALYELAWLNLGSSGGCMAMCWFNPKIRYVMLKILVPGVPQAEARFLEDRGYRIGEQPPFAGPFQKWVWEPDELPVIRREFAAMADAFGAQARST